MIEEPCNQNCKECGSSSCQTGKVLMPERFESVSFAATPSPYPIEEIVEREAILEAMALAEKVFLSCEAPDQTDKGSLNFTAKLNNPSYVERLRVYVAYDQEKIVGMAATLNSGTYLALLYVDEAYQKSGIGQALVAQVIHDDPTDRLIVHAAPSAFGFYEKCGFTKESNLIMDEDDVRHWVMVFYRKKISVQ